jgi:rhamnosyltransferase
MQKNKIEGVVVLYQPDISVVGNIKSYIDGLEHLYIIDNSSETDLSIINGLSAISKCVYIKNQTNKGIANALNQGAKLAIANGADWLLTMDQDSKFEPGDILRLIEFAIQQDDEFIGIVSPFHQTNVSVKPATHDDVVLTTMTSGNLISLFAYRQINGFDERYFIDAVDWDYCLRLNMHNFKVLRLNTVHLSHGLGNATKHQSPAGYQITALNYNEIRRYYITRNKLMFIFKYWRHYPNFCYNVFLSMFRDLRHVLLYEKHKMIKLRFMLKGWLHFITKKTGKLQ